MVMQIMYCLMSIKHCVQIQSIVIVTTHQGRGGEEDDDRGSVVQLEDVVVDGGEVPLVEQPGHRAEDESVHGEAADLDIQISVSTHCAAL